MEITNEYEVQRNRIYSNGVRALFISDFVAQNPIPIPNFDSFIGLKVYNNMISCPNGSAFEGNHINGIFLGHNTLFNNDMVYTLILDTSKNFYSLYNLLVNNSEFGVIRVKLDEDGSAQFSSLDLITMGYSVGMVMLVCLRRTFIHQLMNGSLMKISQIQTPLLDL